MGALLWSLHVFDSIPSPWTEFARQDTYTYTGIVPSRPASIAYWLRGFDDSNRTADLSKQPSNRSTGLRPSSDLQKQCRLASAWFWRSLIFNLQQMNPEDRQGMIQQHPSLKSVIGKLGQAVNQASMRCLSDGLIPYTLDDDFAISSSDGVDLGSSTAFRDLDIVRVDHIRRINQGRMLAFRWLVTQEPWDLESCSGVNGLSVGVSAIWQAAT
jgi:hypothetical protein